MSDSPSPAEPATCRIEGPLVITTVADWHRQLQALLAAPRDCTVDLGAVTQLDLFGLQLLLAVACRRPSGVRLVNPPPALSTVCLSAGLDPALFPVS